MDRKTVIRMVILNVFLIVVLILATLIHHRGSGRDPQDAAPKGSTQHTQTDQNTIK